MTTAAVGYAETRSVWRSLAVVQTATKHQLNPTTHPAPPTTARGRAIGVLEVAAALVIRLTRPTPSLLEIGD